MNLFKISNFRCCFLQKKKERFIVPYLQKRGRQRVSVMSEEVSIYNGGLSI